MAYIDMYSLSPHYSVTDAAVPIQGGELTLEFRRTMGMRSELLDKDETIFATDRILGLGWSTTLDTRVITRFANNLMIATVTDDLGNSYSYTSEDHGSTWVPDVMHTFNNDAMRCMLKRGDNQESLIFRRTFGTELLYRLAKESPPCARDYSEYYRLESVTDRNGNTLLYSYDGSNPLLASQIEEVGNPERRLEFRYNADDKLETVMDPLTREVNYAYDSVGLLQSVTYEQVFR